MPSFFPPKDRGNASLPCHCVWVDSVRALPSYALRFHASQVISTLLPLSPSLILLDTKIFMKIQFPAALPFVFSGVKVAVTLAVIGVVIEEFVRSTQGLGNLLMVANSQINSPLAWASLVALSVLGILLFGAVALAERILMPWVEQNRHG